MDEEEYRELFPKSKARVVFETVCKVLLWVIIFLILGLFALRMWAMKGTSMTKDYLWTDAVLNAGDTTIWSVPEHTSTNTKSLFVPSDIWLTGDCMQLQFTLRYNRSLLSSLAEEKGLDAVPEDCVDLFLFELEDDLGNRYLPKYYAVDSRYVSRFVKLVYEDLDPEASVFRLAAYYVGPDGIREEKASDSMNIYAYNYYKTESKAEKKPDRADERLLPCG